MIFRKLTKNEGPLKTIIHVVGNVFVYDVYPRIYALCRNLLDHVEANAQIICIKMPVAPEYSLPEITDKLY